MAVLLLALNKQTTVSVTFKKHKKVTKIQRNGQNRSKLNLSALLMCLVDIWTLRLQFPRGRYFFLLPAFLFR